MSKIKIYDNDGTVEGDDRLIGTDANGLDTKNYKMSTIADYTKTVIQPDLDAKQDVLVSGINIKTINGFSLLGDENIILSGLGAVDMVNGKTGFVVLDADDIDDSSTSHKFVTSDDIVNLGNLSGVNTGDQDFGFNIITTLAEFDALITGGVGGNWIIIDDITLDGNKTLPSGVTLHFNGGIIYGGGFTLTGNDTKIEANLVQIFDTNITLSSFDLKETYPEWFGAVGDGVQDDTVAIQKAIDFGVKTELIKDKTYKVTSTLTGKSSINGNGSTISFQSGTFINGIDFASKNNFKIENLKVTSSNVTNMFGQAAQAFEFNTCKNFIVENCELTYFTDGISISSCENFTIQNNRIHEMGEELIAVRYSTGWSLKNNYCYNHNGDGILIKGDSVHGGLIEGNTVKDGVNTYGYATAGGGITCNLEGGDTTPIQGLSIKSNIVSATVYGIVLVGATNFDISKNKILDLINGKGIFVDTSTAYNPNSVKGGQGVIEGNIVIGIFDDEGIVSTTSDGVGNLPCVISNNYVDIQNTIQNAVRGESTIISGNIIKGGKTNLNATDSVVNGNTFYDTDGTADAGIKLFKGTTFTNNVIKGWNNYIQIRADFVGNVSGNILDTNSSQRLLTILSGAKGTIINNYLTNSGAGGTITEIDGVFVDNFTRRKNVEQSRTAAPTSGTWILGDIVWNAAPVPSGTIGWVCVTGGTPGTWKAFGTISS